MRKSIHKAFSGIIFLFLIASANGQSVEWKHYKYPGINLQFSLPVDYEFDYPDGESLAFRGRNNLTTFYLQRIDTTITTAEQRKEVLYLAGNFTNDLEEDPNFLAGVTQLGYLYAATVVYVHELEETAVAMLLSDPKDNNLNFFIFVTYGGEGNPGSPAYDQARTILMKLGPIEE